MNQPLLPGSGVLCYLCRRMVPTIAANSTPVCADCIAGGFQRLATAEADLEELGLELERARLGLPREPKVVECPRCNFRFTSE